MKKFLMAATGSAGVAFAATNLLYRGATEANLGFATVPSSWLEIAIPAITGVLFPLLSTKFPSLAGILSWFNRKVEVKPTKMVNDFEISLLKSGYNSEPMRDLIEALRKEVGRAKMAE